MLNPKIFKQIVQSYELLWGSSSASEIDLGGKNYLDNLYTELLKSADFTSIIEQANSCVIDLGAGKGSRLVAKLAQHLPHIIAVDCFPSFKNTPLRYTAEKVLADVLFTGLDDACADFVVSAYVATNNPYFKSQDVQQLYVKEILRLLKPGGIFWGEEKDLAQDIFRNNTFVMDYSYLNPYYIHFFKKK